MILGYFKPLHIPSNIDLQDDSAAASIIFGTYIQAKKYNFCAVSRYCCAFDVIVY